MRQTVIAIGLAGSLITFGVAAWAYVAVGISVNAPAAPSSSPEISSIALEQTFEGEHTLLQAKSDRMNASTSSVSGALLHRPPMAHLLAVSGDLPIRDHEISIRVPVFMYHRIAPITDRTPLAQRPYTVTPSSFLAQMEALVGQGFTTITPDDIERALIEGAHILPKKPVLLTFDDGFREHYTVVFPLLKRLGLKATFFVVTRSSHMPGNLTDAMIQEMDQSGLITMASHTQHHPLLTKMNVRSRLQEIRASKEDLEHLLGHPIHTFAYPYGGVNSTIEQEVAAAGYSSAYGVRLGSRHAPSSIYNLRRIRVLDGEDISVMAEAFLQEPKKGK